MSKRVCCRELSGTTSSFVNACAHERFNNFRLHAEHDTHDQASSHLKLSFLCRRSKIVEIVYAGDIVFALTLAGVCAAFSGSKRIAFLNVTPDEVVRSLFYNKANQSIITVSVYRADNFSQLKCRTTPLEYIRRGKPDAGFAVWETECLRWPGFVEFDDVNGKVLTYSAGEQAYRVWDMTNYDAVYSLPEDDISEIKISPGIMLLILSQQDDHLPLKILSIEDGSLLCHFRHMLHCSKKVECTEQFHEKLLIKQEGEDLQIIDVRTGGTIRVSESKFATPAAFVFLHENQRFLTLVNRTVTVWNLRGEVVTRFDDHVLWHPETNTNNIFITATQDYLISYCRRPEGDHRPGGTVNISSILTGRCVAKLGAGEAMPQLQDVTSIFYSEEREEVYVGTKTGILYVWTR